MGPVAPVDLRKVRTFVDWEKRPLFSIIDLIREVAGYTTPHKAVAQIEKQLSTTFLRKQLSNVGKITPLGTVQQLISIMHILPGKRADSLRTPEFYAKIKEFLIRAFPRHNIHSLLEPMPESWAITMDDVLRASELGGFDIFKGEIRRTRENPPRIAVLDLLALYGEYVDVNQKWGSIKKEHGDFGAQMWAFPGKERYPTPVIAVPKMIELINVLNSPTAARFRQQAAKTLVRYLGGDVTLIKEIRAINQAQKSLPENHPMRVFGEHVEATNSLKRKNDAGDAGYEKSVVRRRLEWTESV